MNEAWIIDACRTPRGIGKKGKGALAGQHPQHLGAVVLQALAERNRLNTADVGELVTFYRGLPLYPGQTQYVRRASEGVRSNMKAVFEAVAHYNPYPAEQFDESVWNQMVLKALFIGSSLQPIMGLDERANPMLMRMLCDYAHERWAAGRNVSPELWRCVGPYADDAAIADLARVLERGTPPEREGAILALIACSQPRAADLLESVPELAARAESGELNWATVVSNGG